MNDTTDVQLAALNGRVRSLEELVHEQNKLIVELHAMAAQATQAMQAMSQGGIGQMLAGVFGGGGGNRRR